MKIPLNWLQSYVNLPEDRAELTHRLTMAGHMLDKIEKVAGDTVVDLELRGNRADCYSILGIAREVKALFGSKVSYPPEHPKLLKVAQLKEAPIYISSPNVHRVMAIVIKDIHLQPSPDWLKKRLEAYGLPAINNIVDLTNYVMVETGEPMHAFDLAQVQPRITIRQAKKGEKMVTFEGTEIELVGDDLVWASDHTILSIAGAIGSKDHSILPATQAVLVEAAGYDQANIRRSVRRHHLLTEAGLRHEKDLDPNLVAPAIYRFLYLIKENNWGNIVPQVFDYYPHPVKEKQLSLSFTALEKIGAIKLAPKTVKEIFLRLNMTLKKETAGGLTVSVPTYRTDIDQEADLVEEVLRIYGYENIPDKILSLEIPPDTTPASVYQENQLRRILTGLGFDEIIGTSFVTPNFQRLNHNFDLDRTEPIKTANPPSPEYEVLQQSLLPALLPVTQKSIDRGESQVKLFEIAKTYSWKSEKHHEVRKIGLTFWQNQKIETSFLAFKGYLEAFLRSLNLSPDFSPTTAAVLRGFSFDIKIGDTIIGHGGLTLRDIFFAQLDLDSLLKYPAPPAVTLWPKYPAITDDLTFVLKPKTPVGELINLVRRTSKLITKVELITTYENTRTLRVTYQSPEKTLTSTEVETIRRQIISAVEQKFGAKLKGK